MLPQLTLTDLAKIMVSSVGVIGVDTGLSHLAAALEIPTISLYGPTSTNLIGTWGKRQFISTIFPMLVQQTYSTISYRS